MVRTGPPFSPTCLRRFALTCRAAVAVRMQEGGKSCSLHWNCRVAVLVRSPVSRPASGLIPSVTPSILPLRVASDAVRVTRRELLLAPGVHPATSGRSALAPVPPELEYFVSVAPHPSTSSGHAFRSLSAAYPTRLTFHATHHERRQHVARSTSLQRRCRVHGRTLNCMFVGPGVEPTPAPEWKGRGDDSDPLFG